MIARPKRFWTLLGIAVLALFVAIFWEPEPHAPAPRGEVLVPGEVLPEYDRTAQYGRPWIDVDGNGCSQRDDILKRDLVDVVLAEDGCKVLRGTLVDPYTGVVVEHEAGPGLRSRVQIDHIYALRDAHDDGAITELTFEERVRLANDPRNLIATSGSVNGSKGSLGPMDWTDRITTGVETQCSYLVSYAVVALEYGLQPDPDHRGFLEADLGNRCDVPSLTTR